MKILRNRVVQLTIAVLIVVGALAVGYWAGETYPRVNDMPGDVYGSNPHHIPESKLPQCDYDGSRFVNEPCYSRPGSLYD